jgi:hypothetical protein
MAKIYTVCCLKREKPISSTSIFIVFIETAYGFEI